MTRTPVNLDLSPEQNLQRRLTTLEQHVATPRRPIRTYVIGEFIVEKTITPDKMNVKELSAISANLGTITVGTLKSSVLIEGVTIKGTLIEGGTVKGTLIEGGTVKGATVEGTTVKGGTLEGNTVKAATIEGATTITGATIKTAASGGRVEITSTGIKGINAASVTKFQFDTATGILTATAVISAEEGSTIPTKVLTGKIKETQIEENSISTPLLQANAVTAAKISVSKLSAISGNIGEVVAGSLEAVTIKAATIEGTTITGGTINSAVVNLPQASYEEAAAKNSINWKSGETVTQFISAFGTTGEYRDIIIGTGSAYNIASGESAFRLQAVSAGKGSEAFHQATLQTGKILTTVMNGLGESAFLQIASLNKQKIARGVVKLKWEGATVSALKKVEHGLGEKPKAVIMTALGATEGGKIPWGNAFEFKETTFECNAETKNIPGIGVEIEMSWIAIS